MRGRSPRTEPAEPVSPGESPIDRAHVLIVDDAEINRELLGRRVALEGHTFVAVENAKQALARLRSEPFDLVLLDVMMPGMTGPELLTVLKGDERLADIPVIMVSAVDEERTVVECLDGGAEDYLPKPVNPIVLRARVRAALARKRLRDRERLYSESLERELAIGRQIQQSFLPEAVPDIVGFELAAHLAPARQVSGDFYDAFLVDDGSALLFAVGDVCDKGVGAALFMALFRSLIRASADPVAGGAARMVGGRHSVIHRALTDVSGNEQLERIAGFTNDYIARVHERTHMFATVFLGRLDLERHALAFVNAGHEAALIVGSNDGVRQLTPTGPALGLMPDMDFTSGSLVLEQGESVVVFTDGVVDARNSQSDTFGIDRLQRAAGRPHSSADEVKRSVLSALGQFTQDAESTDDVTLLVVHRPAV